MTFTEQSVIDRIEILESGQMQIRRADRVLKDGVIISQTYHRHVLSPGDTVTPTDARLAAVANAVWDKETVDKYKATQAAQLAALNPIKETQ
jgi:hypothetical protein